MVSSNLCMHDPRLLKTGEKVRHLALAKICKKNPH